MDALIFGDLEDPESNISAFIKTSKAESIGKKYKTKPSILYGNINLLAEVDEGRLFE